MAAEKRTTPADLLSNCDAAAVRDAAPPMWKVRMVSCVPGSPMDCAAMTPTASHVDQVTAAQIAAVAGCAKAVARVAGERRSHLDLVDPQRFDLLDFVFAEQGAGMEQCRLRFRIDDIRGDGAAEDALAQRLDDLTALDQRL